MFDHTWYHGNGIVAIAFHREPLGSQGATYPQGHMISVEHLSMQLEAGDHAVSILNDITFRIPKKQIVAIVGPSGSGKSTLLGLIAGLDKPTEGRIHLNGTEITSLSETQMVHYRRQHIGYVFQSFHLIPTLTAIENVALPLELNGDPRATDRAIELLTSVGLEDRQHHYPVQLSGGGTTTRGSRQGLCPSPSTSFS